MPRGPRTQRQRSTAKLKSSPPQNDAVDSTTPHLLDVTPTSSPDQSGVSLDSHDGVMTKRLCPEGREMSQDKRQQRNESEKHRRDRLNSHISELAQSLPLVAASNKKLDKSSILRLAVNFLRLNHDFGKIKDNFRQDRENIMNTDSLGNLLVESNNGFALIVRAKDCQIMYASHTITDKFGHFLVDIIGTHASSIIHPSDVNILEKQFDRNGDAGHLSDRRAFYARVKNVVETHAVHYEVVHFQGSLKVVAPLQTAYQQHVPPMTTYLVCVGRHMAEERPAELDPHVDMPLNQYFSYHSLDGKIIFVDQRVSLITGFMMHELMKCSAYEFVVPEDIPLVAWSHYFVMNGQLPSTVFRARNKFGQIGHIRATSHLVLDMWTKKPQYLISINNVLCDSGDGEASLAAHRSKFEALQAQMSPEIIQQMNEMFQLPPQISVHSAKKEKWNPAEIVVNIPENVPVKDGIIAAKNPVLSASLGHSQRDDVQSQDLRLSSGSSGHSPSVGVWSPEQTQGSADSGHSSGTEEWSHDQQFSTTIGHSQQGDLLNQDQQLSRPMFGQPPSTRAWSQNQQISSVSLGHSQSSDAWSPEQQLSRVTLGHSPSTDIHSHDQQMSSTQFGHSLNVESWSQDQQLGNTSFARSLIAEAHNAHQIPSSSIETTHKPAMHTQMQSQIHTLLNDNAMEIPSPDSSSCVQKAYTSPSYSSMSSVTASSMESSPECTNIDALTVLNSECSLDEAFFSGSN